MDPDSGSTSSLSSLRVVFDRTGTDSGALVHGFRQALSLLSVSCPAGQARIQGLWFTGSDKLSLFSPCRVRQDRHGFRGPGSRVPTSSLSSLRVLFDRTGTDSGAPSRDAAELLSVCMRERRRMPSMQARDGRGGSVPGPRSSGPARAHRIRCTGPKMSGGPLRSRTVDFSSLSSRTGWMRDASGRSRPHSA